MRIVVAPIFRKIRRVFADIHLILPRNWQLNEILRVVRRIACLLTCNGEIYSETFDLTNDLTIVRKPDALARETIIVNLGPGTVQVYERTGPVLIIAPQDSRSLPEKGKFLVRASTVVFGELATIEVTTIRRCTCGDPYIPYADDTPIGGDLI